MEQAQQTLLQILLATMGIQQLLGAPIRASQHQGHGVDREIPPGQILR